MSGNPGQIEPRESVVKNVQMEGRYNTHWKTEVTCENGDRAIVFHKSSECGVVVGERISYDITWFNSGIYHKMNNIIKL